MMMCSICSLPEHEVRLIGERMNYCSDPVQRGVDLVSDAVFFVKPCAKAIAGKALRKFEYNQQTRDVMAILNGTSIKLLHCDGYDNGRELNCQESSILIINNLRQTINSKAS